MVASLVETAYGSLQGKQVGPVIQWRGIPFAAPPVGPLRFRPPEPPQPWPGRRDATHFAEPSAQPASPMEALFGAGTGPHGSEDCLYLNVYAPAEPAAAALPVMFWIHGGGFTGGSGSTPWYDGGRFARHGEVVVVTINYRLGALGFSHLAEAGGEAFAMAGNCGLLDQVAALRWVGQNIAAFGGDPDRVTVFGESAGGMSIGALMGLPGARGLFHQAILQSGAAKTVRSADQAAAVTAQLLAELDCGIKDLLEVPVDALLAAQAAVSAKQGASSTEGMLAFSPVVDGTALPRPPIEAVRAGSAAGVRTIVGTNRDEATLFIGFDPRLKSIDDAGLRARGERLFGPRWEKFETGYRRTRPGASAFQLLGAMLTDLAFRMPAVEVAEAQVANGAPTWMYRFDWPTPALGGLLGASHALELPFVWDILGRHGTAMFTGDDPPQALADRMHRDWLAFGTGADPAWPGYEPERRTTCIYDTACSVVEDPDADERRLWD